MIQFPAILLAGPPHSGKSVLSFLLSRSLRHLGVAHYLLRAVPDGEGDWFLQGDAGVVFPLRQRAKGVYSPAFVRHMRQAVDARLAPLLVDVGGLPRGEDQLALLGACTHSVLLYREAESGVESADAWRERLAGLALQPLAELCSLRTGDDPARPAVSEAVRIEGGVLRGSIGGLERAIELRREGPAFSALLEQVQRLFSFDESHLEELHCRVAPFQALLERSLHPAAEAAVGTGARPHLHWLPGDLPAACQRMISQIKGQPLALYGRGPVWLPATLAAHTQQQLALFDIRFGWLSVPRLLWRGPANLRVERRFVAPQEVELLTLSPVGDVLMPGTLRLGDTPGQPAPRPAQPVALSGRLPRWAFAALARHYAPRRPWVGVLDANLGHVVVVHSHSPSMPVGSELAIDISTTG